MYSRWRGLASMWVLSHNGRACASAVLKPIKEIHKMKKRYSFLALAVATLVAGAAVGAEPEDIIKYRKNVMKATAGHMGATAAIITGKVDYKGDLADHARAIQALTKDTAALFPKDSDFGDTEALDAVWKNSGEFKKHAQQVKAKADAFVKVVATNDKAKIATGFKELNDACKSCHKDFRKEHK